MHHLKLWILESLKHLQNGLLGVQTMTNRGKENVIVNIEFSAQVFNHIFWFQHPNTFVESQILMSGVAESLAAK